MSIFSKYLLWGKSTGNCFRSSELVSAYCILSHCNCFERPFSWYACNNLWSIKSSNGSHI